MQRRGPLCCATAALDTRESSFYVSLPPPFFENLSINIKYLIRFVHGGYAI